MNRKLISMAAVATMTSASAFAETPHVAVYGLLNMSIDSVANGNGPTAATRGSRVTNISSNASRIGFKGSEDLGEGIAAVWQVESTIYVNDSTANPSTFATRNSFGGLASDSLGSLLLGRYDTPYKISTRKLDVFGEVLADNRTLMGGVAGKSARIQFDGRQADSLVYLSPSFGGFSAAVSYISGAQSATLASQSQGSGLSVAGLYQKGGLYGSLGYETHKNGSAGTGSLAGGAAGAFAAAGSAESAWKVGLGYKLDAVTLGFAYEKTSDNLGGVGAAAPVASCTAAGRNCFGHSAWYLSGKYDFGSNSLMFAYTQAGNLAGAPGGDTRSSQFSVGCDRHFSRRTMLYALYTRLANGSGINYGLASTGVTTGATAAAGNGARLSAVSFGLKHIF